MYRPRALPALVAIAVLDVALGSLLMFLLAGCNGATVTSGGKPIDNPALQAAARSVDVAETALVVLTDTLTAAYRTGQVPAHVLEQYDQQVVPRVKAALAAARIALTTWAQAPANAAPATVATALLAVQQELGTLQGFWKANMPLMRGATP